MAIIFSLGAIVNIFSSFFFPCFFPFPPTSFFLCVDATVFQPSLFTSVPFPFMFLVFGRRGVESISPSLAVFQVLLSPSFLLPASFFSKLAFWSLFFPPRSRDPTADDSLKHRLFSTSRPHTNSSILQFSSLFACLHNCPAEKRDYRLGKSLEKRSKDHMLRGQLHKSFL